VSTVAQVQAGPLVVKIQVDDRFGEVGDAILAWLGAGPVSGGTPDIIFSIGGSPRGTASSAPDVIVGIGKGNGQRLCYWDGRGWEARISRTLRLERRLGYDWACSPHPGGMLRIARRLPSGLLRLIHPHCASYAELMAGTFIYRQFIPALQALLLERDTTFVHASSVYNVAGEALLLSGWGGSGKTAVSSQLYLRGSGNWAFLSDDLAIVDSQGIVHRSPLPLHVYPYNTERFPELRNFAFARMTRFERFHWSLRRALLGPDGAVKRLPAWPQGDGATTAPLKRVVHLQRWSGDALEVEELSSGDFAAIAKSILAFELRQSLPVYALATTVARRSSERIMPTPDEVLSRAAAVCAAAVTAVPVNRVLVPERCHPVQLTELVATLMASG
jgi:hypothetical protein